MCNLMDGFWRTKDAVFRDVNVDVSREIEDRILGIVIQAKSEHEKVEFRRLCMANPIGNIT